MNIRDAFRAILGGRQVTLVVERVRTEPARAFIDFFTVFDDYKPTHELIPVGTDSPASALARTVLSAPDDPAAIRALMDQCEEWLKYSPDAARCKAALTKEVKETLVYLGDGRLWNHTPRHAIGLCLNKLRNLGYGEVADAVDEYMRPAELSPLPRDHPIFDSVRLPAELLNEADGANYAAATVAEAEYRRRFIGRFDRSHEPT